MPSPEFATELDYFLADAHEPAVRQFLAADFDGFWESMAQVSEFRYTFMRYMIPRDLHYRWERGLGTGDFYLKICGAGGGGFMLLLVKTPPLPRFWGGCTGSPRFRRF